MTNIKSRINRIFFQLIALAKSLSGGNLFLMIFLYFKFLYFSVTRKFFLRNKKLNFKLNYEGKKFSLDLIDNLDIAVLVEIFVLKEYSWNPEHPLKNILDLGAHWGDTAIYYALEYPESKVFSFEPTPETYRRLVSQTAQFPNIFSYNFALNYTSGEVKFYFSENTVGNSLEQRPQSKSSVVVPAISISDLLTKVGLKKFDLVKFDIEGAETVLFSYSDLSGLSRAYIGEIHLDLMPMSLKEIENKFAGFNVQFKKLKEKRYIMTAIQKNN